MTSSPPPEPPTLRSFFGTVTTRRSYSCYNCNHAFYITPTTDTSVSPPPTSFRCPRCLQRHLIPHHTVAPLPPPPPPPPPQPDTSDSPPGIFTYYTSDDFESDYEDYDSDSNSFLSSTFNNNYRISPSALKSLIDSLPIKSFPPKSAEPVQSCSICMEDFENNSKSCETVVELPCKHCFHKNCIGEWLNRSNTCPMCRYKLPIDSSNEKWDLSTDVVEYNELLEFHLDPTTVEMPPVVREPIMRRVNAEVSLSAIAEADALGSDWRVLSNNGGDRSRWFDPMHDEDGDTLMIDA